MSGRTALLAAAFLGATGVMAGAFGAHGLKERVPADLLAVWQTAAEYQMYHSLALLGLGALLIQNPRLKGGRVGLVGFISGILVFSGSLYLLVLTGHRWLGAITPIGGTLLIVGWIGLLWGFWCEKEI